MYGVTFLSVVFLTSYWLINRRLEQEQNAVRKKVIVPYSQADRDRLAGYSRRRNPRLR